METTPMKQPGTECGGERPLRAVLIATGQSAEDAPLGDRYPVPMLPLIDRPFIQHVVESLVAQGVRVFDWVLCHLSEEIEEFLGSGERWGATFHYHLARDPLRPYESIRALVPDEGQDGLVLFGHADRLPAVRLAEVKLQPSERAAVLYGWREPRRPGGPEAVRWSGWAVFTAAAWRALRWDDADEQALSRRLAAASAFAVTWERLARPLGVRDFGELLAAQRAVLEGEGRGLLFHGKATEPGVWLSRNVTVHPSATVVGPVYLGEGCEVGAGARVGPNAVVGADCVIDRRSALANALVMPGTYVGEGLEVDGAVLDRDRVARGRPGQPVWVEEEVAVASLTEGGVPGWLGGLASMALGAALLALALPVLLLTALALKIFRRGPVLYRTRVVRLPARYREGARATFRLWSFCPWQGQGPEGGAAQAGWRHLFCQFLPALVNVARGDLRLVGLPARTPEEVRQLGGDWQAFYLQGRAGVVSEALLYRQAPSPEEAYATEGIYGVTRGALGDLGLLLSYFVRILSGRRRAAAAGPCEVPASWPVGEPLEAVAAGLAPRLGGRPTMIRPLRQHTAVRGPHTRVNGYIRHDAPPARDGERG